MKGSRIDAVLFGLSSCAPAVLAASHVGNVPDAAHDGASARVLGFDPQPWRALDVGVGALLSAFPVGTRGARAALGTALVVGLAGALLYVLARELLGACAETRRLRLFVASVAALTPLVAAPWQIEGSAVGGSVTGGVLVILPIALLAPAFCRKASTSAEGMQAPWSNAALALALAFGYEPLVFVCALAGCVALATSSAPARRSISLAWRLRTWTFAASILVGLGPFLIALVWVRASGSPMSAALVDAWSGERGASRGGSPAHFIADEIGVVLASLAVVGSVLAVLVLAARPLATALISVALSGFVCAWLGAPLGPTRFGGPVLAAFAASCVLAGVAMQAAVRATAMARVPMARTSAAMVILLELSLPVELADDAFVRSLPRAGGAASAWDDAVWGTLPARSVVLATTPETFARALAAQAASELRGDVTVVPTFVRDTRSRRALAADPALVPLWRDLELVGVPGEASLSSLAAVRPLVMPYERGWGRTIGKHLVPVTLFDQFEPEPRGASDRRHALDALAPSRDRLARAIGDDPELTAAALILLRPRADLVSGFTGEADLATRTMDDVRLFEGANSTRRPAP
jgi:hypothetical protein